MLDWIANRFGYVRRSEFDGLKEAAEDMLVSHREYVAAATEAIAALLYVREARGLIDATNRCLGRTEAQIIKLEEWKNGKPD